jgi:hypothetical protein
LRSYRNAQRYDFTVSDEQGEELWRWSHDRAFAQVIGEKTFEPGETVTYTEVWDQTTSGGGQLPPGRYEVLGIDVGCEEARQAECDFGMGLPIEITQR